MKKYDLDDKPPEGARKLDLSVFPQSLAANVRSVLSTDELNKMFIWFNEKEHEFIGIGFMSHGEFTQYADPTTARAIGALEDYIRFVTPLTKNEKDSTDSTKTTSDPSREEWGRWKHVSDLMEELERLRRRK